ncbi:MAG: hypothetical protein JXQ91_07765 [Vannielia sp.]|uniref:hypothetical protein n=1 Tax=Vannielia sp. TaxID=2813045 RepID=UPI003B8E724F
MIRALALLLACAMPLAAQDTRSLSSSTVTLQPTSEPGAVAEIVFVNKNDNGSDDEITFPLVWLDVAVDVTFTWQADGSADAITVETPSGLVAVPRTLTLDENTTGTILIFPLQAAGF